MNQLWQAICFIRQYNDKLDLYCNTLKEGHSSLVWYKVGDADNFKESPISSQYITITGLEEGEYCFYTKNEKSNSVKMCIKILQETTKEAIDRIEQYIDDINKYHKNALEALREHGKNNPDMKPANYLIDLYKGLKTQEAKEKNAYFQLITIAQYCDNYRSVLMNKDNESPVYINNNPQVTIEVGTLVTKVIVYRKVGSMLRYCSTIHTEIDKKQNLQLVDNEKYVIEAYARNNLVGVYTHFSGNDTTRQLLWAKLRTSKNKKTDAKEQLIELPSSFSCFTEEEQQRILIESSINPYDELVSRPRVINAKDSVNIMIENPELLTALGKFYVVAKEQDQLFANGFERIEEITGPNVSFNKAMHLLSDMEDYYFYIQDESRNLVSKLELLSLTGTDYDDYKENTRQLELYSYSKRLMTAIDYYIPVAKDAIKELLETAKGDTDVNTANVYKYLINHLNVNKCSSYFNGAVNAIMEDHISNGAFNQQFFPNGIKYEKAINKLIFPPKTDKYILCVDRIDLNQQITTTEYYESGIGAIELQSRGSSYFIYQAFDKKTYRRSGYVFVNATKYNPCISKWNIDIEVI